MTLPRVETKTIRPSGANTGSKLWMGAPLSVQPGTVGVAAMAPFLSHALPSTLTVQIAKGSLSLALPAKTTRSPFHETDGWRTSAVCGESPVQPLRRLRQAPPAPAIAPVAAFMVRALKQRSDGPP